MFEMYSACGSINKVMRVYSGKYGMPSSKPAFKRMLSSPFYKGEHPTGVKDFCPAIVPPDLWDDVQRKLKINIKSNNRQVYLFSGLICCAECGRHFGANTRRRKRGNCLTISHNYRCVAYWQKIPKTCDNSKIIAENVLERYLVEHIRPMVEGLLLQYEIEEQARDRTADRIAAIERKLSRLKELYINDLIDMETYKADRADLMTQLEDLRDKAAQSHTEDVEALKQLLKPDMWEMYGDFTPEEKRRFWRGILEKITFSREREFTIYFL